MTSYIWQDADLITTLRELDYRIFNSRTGDLVTSTENVSDISPKSAVCSIGLRKLSTVTENLVWSANMEEHLKTSILAEKLEQGCQSGIT